MDKADFEAWLESPQSLYRRCTDPECPHTFAYRDTEHFHYVGPGGVSPGPDGEGSSSMTMNQQEKDALSQNWDQAKSQIQSQFPGVDEGTLEGARQHPDTLASHISQTTGEDQNQVEQKLRQVAQQYTK